MQGQFHKGDTFVREHIHILQFHGFGGYLYGEKNAYSATFIV